MKMILQCQIPNLLASEEAGTSTDLAKFYNNSTYKEYPLLLCELLRRFLMLSVLLTTIHPE